MPESQRFPLGTRVANPLEGRTGEITAFDAKLGLYTLVCNDDHRDVLSTNQTEQFVIQIPAKVAKECESDVTKACESDPNQFLGVTVIRSSTSYEGNKFTTSGQVTQYFADIKRFRVLFSDGLYADMTLEEVKQHLQREETESDQKRVVNADEMVKKNKSKQDRYQEMERPLNTQKFDSRKTAYTMCREVLSIILNQKKGGKHCSEKQKVVLNNKDLPPKRALEAFVEADGLNALEKILGIWFRLESTRSAALLVMKVLAMLPGVKEEHLRKTNIARTLRGIEKLSYSSHIDVVFGDLAHWIIQKWVKTAMNRSFNRSARDLLLEQQAQIRRAGTAGQVHLTARPATKLTPQQKETMRLEALRTGTDASAEFQQDPGEEVVVYLPQFNSLGSENMRRPVRQTQVIESLAAKINRDYADSVKKHHEDDGKEKEDGVAPGRIVFGKPQLMHFSQHIPVIGLFSTTRSKIVDKNTGIGDGAVVSTSGDNSAPKTLSMPNKTQAPQKSILKVRDEVITPASQVSW
ncbi:hypothetical protein KXD40_007148 [Peronospora effusa]|uniref:TFIIS N-terminal domain-containing protein n=1 Tax=Peronospora effusa TaxID=542832 RepID=A0A3M6VAI1_9STRA|nr:hypothetical protein DD238_007149 [Peronospora effusa]RQM09517.1 hypothetical protein DD237_007541 [Peronospora effusa]UIZ29068.1 hypothetical protein KXD40_007148 [Peronospora effusa]